MVKAIEYIRSKDLEPESLIHDGLKISMTSLIDCKELGEYVRLSTGLVCSFAIEPHTRSKMICVGRTPY